MNEKYKRLLSDTGLFALGNFGSKFVLFFLVPLYTNVLTTSEYGLADLITTSTSLIIPFVTLSINDALLRLSLDKNEDSENVLWQAIYVLLSSSVVLIALYPVINYLNLFNGYTGYFIVITMSQSFRSTFSLYLKSINKVRIFAIDSILYTTILCISNIALLILFKLKLEGYLISQFIAISCSIVFMLIAGKISIRSCKHLDRALMKRMLLYSIPLIANGVSWWVINSSDRYMLKYFIGESAVGIYAVAIKMPSLLTAATSVFYQAWVINSIVEYENGKDLKFYENVFKIYLLLLSIGASLVMLVLKPFMSVYVGPDFVQSWMFVPVLLLAAIFSTFANFFMAFYKSTKKNFREVIATGLGAIINIVLNLVLIPLIGIQGACVATLVSQLLMALFVIYDTRRFLAFCIDFKKFFIALFIVLIQGCYLVIGSNSFGVSVAAIACLIVLFRNDLKNVILLVKR